MMTRSDVLRGLLVAIGTSLPCLHRPGALAEPGAGVPPRPGHAQPARQPTGLTAARAEARARLAAVRRWGCQYQNLDLAALAAAPLDLLVVEPIVDGSTGRFATPEEVRMLQRKPDGGRRLVLAYLSVGAAEEYRPYWQPQWRTGPAPEWLGTENTEWPRSYPVRYWQPGWRRIVSDGLARLVEAGYDGAFLDRVDAFFDWRDVRPTAEADMAELVADLAAEARRRSPGFLMIGQNAEPLLPNPVYADAIDAVSKESLLTGLRGAGMPNSKDDIDWSLGYLRPAQESGLLVFAIEYLDDPDEIARSLQRHGALGFVPFFANRLLDRLPMPWLAPARSD